MDVTYNEGDEVALLFPPVVDGPSSFSPTGGVFNISGVRFTGSPGY